MRLECHMLPGGGTVVRLPVRGGGKGSAPLPVRFEDATFPPSTPRSLSVRLSTTNKMPQRFPSTRHDRNPCPFAASQNPGCSNQGFSSRRQQKLNTIERTNPLALIHNAMPHSPRTRLLHNVPRPIRHKRRFHHIP